MRNRHISRVCRNCQGPLARQENACWRCGVEWATEEAPSTTLRLVHDGAATRARRANEARRDAERWTNEGGSFAAEAAVAIGAASGR